MTDPYAPAVDAGIPPDVVQAFAPVSLAFRAWGARATVTRTLRQGDVVEVRGRKLEVGPPGHSPTDAVFHDRERKLLIAWRPPDQAHLLIASLRRTQSMELDRARERPHAIWGNVVHYQTIEPDTAAE